LTTVVAVLCSTGVCTNWVVVVGVGFSFVGFGSLSPSKHPEAGIIVTVGGFLFRFLGPPLIFYGLFFEFIELLERRLP